MQQEGPPSEACSSTIFEYGKPVDFGAPASDYGRWRAGYPEEVHRRLETLGVGRGQSVLDLATGGGFLGRRFVRRGCAVVGLDISQALMSEARVPIAMSISRSITCARRRRIGRRAPEGSTSSVPDNRGAGPSE